MKASRAIGIVSLVTLASKVTGFVREMAIAHGFGAGIETDAYRVAHGVPGLFFACIGAALMTVLVPIFTKRLRDGGRDEASAFANRLGSLVLLATAAFSAIAIMLAPAIVRISAPGFTTEARELSVSLTRVLLPGLLFSVLAHLAAGTLHSLGEFGVPAARGLPLNFIIVGAVFTFSGSHGIQVLAWAYLAGLAAEFLIQVPSLLKRGFRLGWIWAPKDPSIRQAVLLMAPVVTGTALLQVNTVTSRIFASMLPAGSISVLEYSNRLVALVTGIVISAVATVMLPEFSRLAVEGKRQELSSRVGRAVTSLNSLILPMSAGLIVLSAPIVRFVYERGAFTADATGLTALALSISGASLVGWGLREVVTRAFYAVNDTKTPMVNSIIAMGLNVVFLFIFVSWLRLGVAGMALATTCSTTWAGLSLAFRFHREYHPLDLARVFDASWRALAATIAMAAVVVVASPLVGSLLPGASFVAQAMRLGLLIGAGGIVYVLVLTVLRSEDAARGWRILRSVRDRVLRGKRSESESSGV